MVQFYSLSSWCFMVLCFTLFLLGVLWLPLSRICHTSPTMMRLSTVIPYLKKFQKICFTWQSPWVLLTQFHWKSNFANQEIPIWHIISNSFNFFRVFKDSFNKPGCNFDDVSKKGSIGLYKVKVFWNKDYDMNFSPWRHQQNFITSLKLYWPMLGNSSISLKEVIITSIPYGFDQKNHFFERWSWFISKIRDWH